MAKPERVTGGPKKGQKGHKISKKEEIVSKNYHFESNTFNIFLTMGYKDITNDEMTRTRPWLSRDLGQGGP